MEYVKLGRTGLDVSPIVLGCMSYGIPERGNHTWVIEETHSRSFIKKALDLGINFFDTANIYSDGTSEEILGRALKDFAKRDEVVIATKVGNPVHTGPNGRGLSRKAIMTEIDKSLKRLNTDYVDLYQIHRWDSTTPIEVTMEALHDVVKAGKARYIGASSMYAWQFQRANHVAQINGWTRFVSMQNYLNLLYREEEREMLSLCQADGVAVIPWSPLARGRLTRKWNEISERSQKDFLFKTLSSAMEESDKKVVEIVGEIATEHNVPPAQIALAWVMQKSAVTAPIIGVTKLHHLDDAVKALAINLTPEEVARLEAPYVPHPVLVI
ncbi:aldo/keto reductase [Paenibacillus brasilensis]|uniref:Aryl-alcohol dehydrogenase-like predicted oxidoreductase n=1 Tax=Paenibacillus brasilensis TaxID=128574 RepID=A0ABU0L6L3_9BACL|nr:aldo/keto reductase [Paenibacillus brasilensis]MDQ0496899.1 aryl-alcohol dehydrogenase-like predicted oxidoreductase [Paenibacillus brasilensis]